MLFVFVPAGYSGLALSELWSALAWLGWKALPISSEPRESACRKSNLNAVGQSVEVTRLLAGLLKRRATLVF
jgi:hypothetical protein